jgi:hypothetical protein
MWRQQPINRAPKEGQRRYPRKRGRRHLQKLTMNLLPAAIKRDVYECYQPATLTLGTSKVQSITEEVATKKMLPQCWNVDD